MPRKTLFGAGADSSSLHGVRSVGPQLFENLNVLQVLRKSQRSRFLGHPFSSAGIGFVPQIPWVAPKPGHVRPKSLGPAVGFVFSNRVVDSELGRSANSVSIFKSATFARKHLMLHPLASFFQIASPDTRMGSYRKFRCPTRKPCGGHPKGRPRHFGFVFSRPFTGEIGFVP